MIQRGCLPENFNSFSENDLTSEGPYRKLAAVVRSQNKVLKYKGPEATINRGFLLVWFGLVLVFLFLRLLRAIRLVPGIWSWT